MHNENKRLKRKVRNSYAISTISIALVLLLVGAAGFAIAATMRTAAEVQNSVTLIVELSNDMQQQERETLKAAIEEYDMVSEVKFSSKEEKINDEGFRKIFSAELDIIEALGENPLLDSYDVKVNTAGREAELDNFVEYIKGVDGVEHISYPEDFVKSMNTVVSRARPILLILAAVLAVISLTLLGSTVRLAIYSKRYIINTMKLVGATKWFIIRPFVRSSIGQGFIAGVLAAAMLVGGVYAVSRSMPEIITHDMLMTVCIIVAGMVAAGILLSSVFTLLTVNKFVNMKSNKIHLY